MHDAMARGRDEWIPPLVLAGIATLGFAAYNTAPPAIANLVVFLYAGSLVLGPSIVYPRLRRMGSTVERAIAGAIFVPLLWVLKECLAMSRVFAFSESAYYAFNPLSLGLFFAAALQMSVCELILRRSWHQHWDLLNGAGMTLFLLLAAAGSYAFVAWREDPSYIFWVYIEIYRRLLGG
jgi:hypothetical protein